MSVEFFFELAGKGGGCGLCALNTILTMFGKRGVIFPFSSEKGISPKRILRELRRTGLIAEPKTISIRNLRRHSILWYPLPRDHYVVVRKIANGKALIYDSEKNRPYWCRLSILKKKWYRWHKGRWCGWVIEVKKK
ncbi:MAG: cysteine peptidase family C39 domain-containing protein [Patescibacteria group bacterium]